MRTHPPTFFSSLCRLAVLGSFALPLAASAGIFTSTYTTGFANGGVIPDGSVAGWSDTRTISGLGSAPIVNVTMTLDVSGGYNGDLYAYLSYNGTIIPLLNRVGVGTGNAFGSSDAGFNITLSSAAATDIHLASAGGSQLTGTYQPDGRTIDPLSAPASFDAASRVSFHALDGMNANGNWTLFFADVTASDEHSTINGYSISVEVVPEPVTAALGICLAVWAGGQGWLALRKLQRARLLGGATNPSSHAKL